MASLGEFNWLGQGRVDIPHLRMIESSMRGDLDALGYMLVAQTPQIVTGFELLSDPTGKEASLLTFKVAGSKLIHPLASDSGSIFAVPSNRPNEVINPVINPRIPGAIQPNAVNFIGIDLKRSADASTADSVAFLDPSQNTETSQKVPLRRTLDYVWVISQTDFTYNRSVCAVAIVTTNNLNVVTAFKDARPLMGRLTPGGSVPSAINVYGFPGGRTDSDLNPIAGDKALRSFKDIFSAIETRLWELGGGESWYSPTADRNVQLHTGGAVFSSSGESFEVVGGNLHWKGLSFSFDNSPQYKAVINDQLTDVPGLTDLLDSECIYVDLNRTSTAPLTAQKGQLTTLGLGQKPGSRWVIASLIGTKYYVTGQPWPIGSSFSVATVSHSGTIKTNIDFVTADPVAATIVTEIGSGAQGMVTACGVSNNIDIGTAHTSVAPMDIQIGRGPVAGDLNVFIKTEGAHSTVVSGTGDKNVPHLMTRTGGGMPYTSAYADSTHLDLDGLCKFEGTRSWALGAISVLPLAPTGGGAAPTFVKYFVKQTKTWKQSCRLVMLSSFGSYAYNSTDRTLTGTTVFTVNADGTSGVNGDRILVNLSGGLYNGIYTVTNAGGTGPVDFPVLTRDNDAGGPLSATVLGVGYDIFDGVAVKVTSGAGYSGYNWVLDAPHVAGACGLDGTTVNVWYPTDLSTADQMCIQWWDGSYTAISTSPSYLIP
jgi:hypothetical protein